MHNRVRLAASMAVVLMAGLGGPAASAPSPNYVNGRTNWLATRYPQAFSPLRAYRLERYGRTAEVDYMLGTSACRIAGQRAWGARVLNYIVYSYALTGASRAQVQAERDLCRQTGQLAAVSPEARRGLDRLVPAGATARGKMFSFDSDKSIAAYPARQERQIAQAELARRLVPVGQRQQIETVLRSIAPASARIQVTGRYAFVVTSDQTQSQVNEIATALDRYLAFLSSEYGIAAPDTYITLYLVRDIGDVQAAARSLHGLDVSPSTLGYAYQDDLSTVALIRGTQAGTLLHELFHLLVRQSFGDIPQWLDEGIAGLYEVSAFRGARLEGLPNWRGRVLSSGWSERPTLASVVASPWFAFDMTGNDDPGFVLPAEKMALNLATARYMTLFLQQRGDLAKVYRAFQSRDPGAVDDPAAGAVALVEQTVGPLALLQDEYDRWFQTVRQADETNGRGSIGKTLPQPPSPANAAPANMSNAPANVQKRPIGQQQQQQQQQALPPRAD